MKDNKSNSFSEREFAEYHQINSIPRNILLMEAECFNTVKNKTTNTQTSENGILFGLGFLATLLFFSGLQLHYSLNIAPAKSEINKPQKAFTSNTKTLATEITLREFNKVQKYQKINFSNTEINNLASNNIRLQAAQNIIAQGKF
ncbi:MAG: hypothetical protein ACRC80_13945 [Waterburya sp.]